MSYAIDTHYYFPASFDYGEKSRFVSHSGYCHGAIGLNEWEWKASGNGMDILHLISLKPNACAFFLLFSWLFILWQITSILLTVP